MKLTSLIAITLISSLFLIAGCTHDHAKPGKGNAKGKDHQDHKSEPSSADEIQAARAKLSPEDRKLVDAQEFCAISKESRLGEMGVPIKVMVKDQPVFLCCKGCQKAALANPDKTLATVEELQKKASAEKK